MTHTSSIDDNYGILNNLYYAERDPDVSLGDFLERYLVEGGAYYSANSFIQGSQPGTTYHYTNIGVALLGYLVECIARQDFADYCRENIFEPLSMENTSFRLNNFDFDDIAVPYYWNGNNHQAYQHYTRADYPAGNLRTCASQFAKYLIAMLQYGSNGDARILDSTTVARMLIVEREHVEGNADVGLIWFRVLFENNYYWRHNGSGFGYGTQTIFHLPTSTGFFMFANREGAYIDNFYNVLGPALIDFAWEWMTYGAIEGHAVDAETEEPIEGATVSTLYGRTAETDEDGYYFLSFGDSVLTVTVPGYNDLILEDLELAVDDTLQVNFEMLHPELALTIDEINAELNPGESTEEQFSIQNTGTGAMNWWMTKHLSEEAGGDAWNLRQSIPAGNIVGDSRIHGVVFINDRYYVSGGGNDLNMIYIFDQDGNQVGEFQQFGESNYGLRDLAYDGTLIWGVQDRNVYGFTPDGELVTTFEGPYASNTNIAWDPDLELLWINSATSNIVGCDREGNAVTTLDRRGLRTYGLAYYPDEPDGYRLFLMTNPGNGSQVVYQMHTETGDTARVAVLEASGSPGGSFITDQYDIYNNWVFMDVPNDGSNDRIDIWQLKPNTDWMVIDPVEGELDPESETEISLTLDATGLAPFLWEGELVFDHAVALEKTHVPIALNVLGDGDQSRELIVPLEVNWNMISINVTPPEEMWEREEGPDIILMTDQLRIDENNHHLLLMKDEDGRFYLSAFGFNNIPYWDLTQGYLVKVDEDVEAVWSGEPILAGADIPLERDWNLIAYFPPYDLDASAPDFYVISPIIDHVLIAKNGDGQFMLPAFNFSNMPTWCEGQGYQVKVDEDVVLNYPLIQEEFASEGEGSMNRHVRGDWAAVSTCQNMSLLVNGCESGQIAAFTNDGTCVGIGTIEPDGRCGLAVWGDDESTEEKDGLSEGESFELKYLDTDIELEATAIREGKGLVYETNSFTVIDVAPKAEIPEEYYLSQNYPNPFNSTTRIKYGLPENGHVSLTVYDISGRVVQTLIDMQLTAGHHTVEWDAGQVSSGLYLIQLEVSNYKAISKVVLAK